MAELAVECWRLAQCMEMVDDASQRVGLSHVHRKIAKFLENAGLQTLDLVGQPYDPGLALEVLETLELEGAPPGSRTIGRMTSPIVLYQGQVVRHGVAVVFKGVETSTQAEETR